jgi:hypothetical protein
MDFFVHSLCVAARASDAVFPVVGVFPARIREGSASDKSDQSQEKEFLHLR